MNAVIGMNMSRLFGLDYVSLRRAEIYINNSKGINCSFDFDQNSKWPLGKYIIDELKIIRDNVGKFCLIFLIFSKILHHFFK